MAQVITDTTTIKHWIDAKQANEQELAKRLYRVFNSGEAIKKMRIVVQRAVWNMIRGPEKNAKDALNKECGLLVFKKNRGLGATIPGLKYLIEDAGNLTANDCAELIRLVGDWIERGGLNQPGDQTGNLVKKEFRPKRGPGKADIAWDKPYRDRHTYFDKPKTIEERIPKMMQASFSGVSNAGSFILEEKDTSSVAKIDKLFGLFAAAGISGTTSDTAAICGQWGWDLLASGYYLMPVGVFHYNLHHTILEAALALSLNKMIDYRIGFYTTLGKGLVFPEELRAIETHLANAERDFRNRHFLAWYEKRQPVGCILFGEEEKKCLKERWALARGSQLLLRAPRLPEYPARKTVRQLIDELAPQLMAGLPREMRMA